MCHKSWLHSASRTNARRNRSCVPASAHGRCIHDFGERDGLKVPPVQEMLRRSDFSEHVGKLVDTDLRGVPCQYPLSNAPAEVPAQSTAAALSRDWIYQGSQTVGVRCKRIISLSSPRQNPSSKECSRERRPHAGVLLASSEVTPNPAPHPPPPARASTRLRRDHKRRLSPRRTPSRSLPRASALCGSFAAAKPRETSAQVGRVATRPQDFCCASHFCDYIGSGSPAQVTLGLLPRRDFTARLRIAVHKLISRHEKGNGDLRFHLNGLGIKDVWTVTPLADRVDGRSHQHRMS